MKKLLIGLMSSALVGGALLAFSAVPAFAKTHRVRPRPRVLGAAVAACNATARDAMKAARADWKATVDKLRADRLSCLKSATSGADRKACNKTAKDAMKSANDALKAKYKDINKVRVDCVQNANGSTQPTPSPSPKVSY